MDQFLQHAYNYKITPYKCLSIILQQTLNYSIANKINLPLFVVVWEFVPDEWHSCCILLEHLFFTQCTPETSASLLVWNKYSQQHSQYSDCIPCLWEVDVLLGHSLLLSINSDFLNRFISQKPGYSWNKWVWQLMLAHLPDNVEL